jgi:type III secretion protein U
VSSEERDLPASQQKLRKARQKGQVAHSSDFNAAMALIASLVYLAASTGTVVARWKAVWDIPLDFHDAVRAKTLEAVATALAGAFIGFVGPLLAVIVAAALFSDLAMKRGFVLSFDPVSPKFDRLNPIAGLGNLFSLRKLIDLGKAFVKVSVLGFAEVLILTGVINALVWLPQADVSAVPATWAAVMRSLAGVAIAVFAINGIVDMRLQSWLFLRDQRMSKTEKKQEAKDQRQNPEIMREVRKQGRGDKNDPKLAILRASIVIGDGDAFIALRFVKEETPAPLCVLKMKGKTARKLFRDAEKRGIAIEPDAIFAERFFDTTPQNGYPPTECYGDLAAIMRRHGLL